MYIYIYIHFSIYTYRHDIIMHTLCESQLATDRWGEPQRQRQGRCDKGVLQVESQELVDLLTFLLGSKNFWQWRCFSKTLDFLGLPCLGMAGLGQAVGGEEIGSALSCSVNNQLRLGIISNMFNSQRGHFGSAIDKYWQIQHSDVLHPPLLACHHHLAVKGPEWRPDEWLPRQDAGGALLEDVGRVRNVPKRKSDYATIFRRFRNRRFRNQNQIRFCNQKKIEKDDSATKQTTILQPKRKIPQPNSARFSNQNPHHSATKIRAATLCMASSPNAGGVGWGGGQ